jgi:hypothetical protein
MFNGKCKIWKVTDGTFVGEFTVEGSNGVAKLRRGVRDGDSVRGWADDGADALEALKSKMEYIAGFLPLSESIGNEAYGKSKSLFEAMQGEDTRADAIDEIGGVKSAADAGDDAAYDIDYGLRRISKMARAAQKQDTYVRGVMDDSYDDLNVGVDEIGFKAFKKLGKFIKKNPVTAAAMVLAPPVAAVKLIRDAKKRQGASRVKVQAIRRLAMGVPVAPGAPVPTPDIQATAEKALFNLRAADATESAYTPPDEGSYDEPQEYYEYEGENEDNVGALFSFGKKAQARLGKAAAFVNKQKWVASLPMVGPGIASAASLVSAAKIGDKSAEEKIKTIASLAKAGVPKAEAAAKNIKTANELLNKAPDSGSFSIVVWFKSLLGIK